MLRLGLCCKFLETPIRFRTTTIRYLETFKDKEEKAEAFISKIVLWNVENLWLAVSYCIEHQIGSFRIGSDLFPIFTHPEWGYHIEDLPDFEAISEGLDSVKALAEENNIRLTFHPDQFVILSSPSATVVKNSIAELEYQGWLAERLGADVLNIHGGGGYGNKSEALKRFASHFNDLSPRVKRRLTVENDDRTYSPEELLPLCDQINIPLVYDVHHHRCLPDDLSIEKATQEALKTWNREPLFHISSPKESWDGRDPKKHHDYIQIEDMPLIWKSIPFLTVEVEAKAKELAVLKLQNELKNSGWNLYSSP